MAMQQSSIVAHSRPPPALMDVGSLALKMRWLQELRLTNTGIKRLEDLSKCWPLLRHILIDESGLQYLKVGKLPNLEVLLFSTSGAVDWESFRRDRYMVARMYMLKDYERDMHGLLAEKDLLAGCPNLKTVRVLGACMEYSLGLHENGMLQTLDLGSFWDAESFPDLAKATQSLTRVRAFDCPQLTHVNFHMHRFQVLREVMLQDCPSLVQVHGLDHLVSLRHLRIDNCAKLQTVSGLSGLVRLEVLEVWGCDRLERLSGVRDLVSLQTFIVGEGSDLQNLSQLAKLFYYQHAFLPGAVLQWSNFVNLTRLHVYFNNTGTFISLGDLQRLRFLKIEGAVKCEEREVVVTHEQQLVDVATLLGVSLARVNDIITLRILGELHIKGLRNLASLNGITTLRILTSLTLQDLPNLTRLSGIETLVFLKKLRIEDCESIEELPLSLMLKLEELHLKNCSKLKSLDGSNASQRLEWVSLTGCKEMEHFPLSDTTRLKSLSIEGSKFASNIETLVQWVVASANDAHALREASLWALVYKFRGEAVEGRIKVMVVETVGVELINRLIPNDDDSFDFTAWAANERLLSSLQWKWGIKLFEDPMRILLGEVSGKSKRWLKEQLGCPGNSLFKERLIASLAATHPKLVDYVLMPRVFQVFER